MPPERTLPDCSSDWSSSRLERKADRYGAREAALEELKKRSEVHQQCGVLRKTGDVVITDDCPGGPCESDAVHFDLSGTAFDAMAISGKADQLRNAGMLQVQYTRWFHADVNIVFHVDAGSNSYYFAVVVEYVNGDGELGAVDLLASSAGAKWLSMQHLEGGAVWKLNYWSSPLHPPFSLRVTTPTGKILTAADVIPADWQPWMAYKSLVNFKN
ncbi:Expansin-B15 [Platanthera guangdongensis]|uniref:Expansin-B15 n=1 Tax=Platanthera guangdongensis TaxID=2320717 RepID=A0ABR2MK81_9ASPA